MGEDDLVPVPDTNTPYEAIISATAATMIKTAAPPFTHPVTVVLPPDYLQHIGRIMVEFSYIEWLLRMGLFALAGVDPEVGRIVIKDPRVEQLIERIQQLAQIRGFTFSTDLDEMSKVLKVCQTRRDLVGHGVWLSHAETGQLCVQNISGHWPRQSRQPRIVKRQIPEAMPIDQTWFEAAHTQIKNGIQLAEQFRRELDALPKP